MYKPMAHFYFLKRKIRLTFLKFQLIQGSLYRQIIIVGFSSTDEIQNEGKVFTDEYIS